MNAEILETPHWFTIDGVQDGRRTVEEQMRGLHGALAECKGKTVLDLGCAEGLIAIEFAKAGAVVTGCDCNTEMIETAEGLAFQLSAEERPRFETIDLNVRIPELRDSGIRRYDVVLALAVLHKLGDPGEGAAFAADSSASLLIVRLPQHQDGSAIRGKHSGVTCNMNRIIARRGFVLEATHKGPRHEAVQYWRRKT